MSKANSDTVTPVVVVEDGTSKSIKHAEAHNDIAADKYAWWQEMLEQPLATNVILKYLIPKKRQIIKVLQNLLRATYRSCRKYNAIASYLNWRRFTFKNTALLDMELSVSLVR